MEEPLIFSAVASFAWTILLQVVKDNAHLSWVRPYLAYVSAAIGAAVAAGAAWYTGGQSAAALVLSALLGAAIPKFLHTAMLEGGKPAGEALKAIGHLVLRNPKDA